MSEKKKLTIGLFGFGVVGEGIYQVLQQTPSLRAEVKKICIKHPDKKRNAPAELFTTDPSAILDDKEIDLVVELIDDPVAAYAIACSAMTNKKNVVSANKKMIADNLANLLGLQRKYEVSFLYEAAVCGSIPIIRNLEEYYDNDLLQSLCGIVNGSTNFILTKMLDEKLDYKFATLQAQQLGFAETDPSLDVKGLDAANKLTILLCHAYGIVVSPGKLLKFGIDRIHGQDAKFAEERGLRIKLTAQAKKLSGACPNGSPGRGNIASFVLPQFVTEESQLYNVKNEFNGMVLQSSFADKQFLYGKGAGRYPTSSAVLSDISALRYDYKYEYRKLASTNNILSDEFYFRLYVSVDKWTDIDLKNFEWLDEFYCHGKRQYLTGVISYRKLRQAPWLKNPSVSIIVCPDGVIEDISEYTIRNKSLELAGVKKNTMAENMEWLPGADEFKPNQI